MRPTSLTVLTLILVVMAAPKFVNALYAVVVAPGAYSIFGVATTGLTLLATYGIWKMHRWGVFLFLAVWVVQVATLQFFSLDATRDQLRYWFFGGLLIVFLAVVLSNWKLFNGSDAASPQIGE